VRPCILLLFLFTISHLGEAQGQTKTFGVIIGITSYENSEIPKLQFADKDANLFYSHLRSSSGGNVPKENLKLLLNKEATISAIYEALDWLKEQCSENDLAYIHFSGHGDLETKEHKTLGYLLAYNSPPNNYSNNAISLEELNADANFLTLEKKAKVILVTDACHSGKLAGDFFKGKQFVNEQLQIVLNNEVRLTSCAVDEEAAEGQQWGNGRGVFSYYLINGLSGFADISKDGTIVLQELKEFFKISFKDEKSLISLNLKQNPVLDGNPNFPVGRDIDSTFESNRLSLNSEDNSNGLPAGLSIFQRAQPQAIDYFFQIIDTIAIENSIDFNTFSNVSEEDFPIKFIRHFNPDSASAEFTSVDLVPNQELFESSPEFRNEFKNKVYSILNSQVSRSKSLQRQLTKRFIVYAHNSSQKIINAYLASEGSEMEKRQYYARLTGYSEFLKMIKVANKLVPSQNHLANVLEVNYHYLSGLVARLNLARSSKTDSLLQIAFPAQFRALKLEPFGAYIHNEIGNLYTYKNMLDSAKYHYDFASVLAPTWVIPWSNKIRLNLLWNKLDLGLEALSVADSLKPGFDLVQINGGMLMERISKFAAEEYYLNAIKKNKQHYLPFERLAYLFTQTGEFEMADWLFYASEELKSGYNIFAPHFEAGIAATFGVNDYRIPIPERADCDIMSNNLGYRKYRLLFEALSSESDSTKTLDSLMNEYPELPLGNHYLGKKFFKNEQWTSAKKHFQKAVENYEDQVKMGLSIANDLNIEILDSCLVAYYESYHYDIMEDYNLLSVTFEKLDSKEQAVEQYEKIIELDSINSGLTEEYRPTGGIRLSRFYRRNKRPKLAEEVILKTLASNRSFDYLQREIFSFYHETTRLFPRYFYWKGKLGLMLHKEITQRPTGWMDINYSDFFAEVYKFTADKKEIDKLVREPGERSQYFVSGLDEFLIVGIYSIDKHQTAIENLEGALALSGDSEPSIVVQEALADLYLRTLKFEKASLLFKDILARRESPKVRKKLFYTLLYEIKLEEATHSLIKLHEQNQISEGQLLVLAQNLILSKDYLKAKKILESFVSADNMLMEFKNRLQVLLPLEKEEWSSALNATKVYLESNTSLFSELPDEGDIFKRYGLYQMAQIYAKQGEKDLAFSFLIKAMDAGFDFSSLLKQDPTWDTLRTTEHWNQIKDYIEEDGDYIQEDGNN
jgi:hypothetical protein